MYSRWALRAMGLWKQRQEEFGRQLFYPIGRLQMAPFTTPEMAATQTVLKKLNVPYETLTAGEITKRWPQIRPYGIGAGA